MSDFGDINTSPNSVSTAYTSMLFTAAARSVPDFIVNNTSYDPWTQEWTGYITECKNNQFGGFQATKGFGTGGYYLGAIRNLNKIISFNQNPSTNNTTPVTTFGSNRNQIAAAKTLRAFFYMTLTDIVGPIPYSEAFLGDSTNNWKPKFDAMADIYSGLDADLKTAYSEFDTSGSLSEADVLYGGDIAKWKKFNATLRMMMAIKMADVDPANGKTRFAAAYADGGMTAVEDGFNYTYDSNTFAPFYYMGNPGYVSSPGYGANKTIVNYLKDWKDNRLLVYFDCHGFDQTHNPKVDQSKLEYGVSDSIDAIIDKSFYGIGFGLMSNNDVAAAEDTACYIAQDPYCQKTATYGVITTARCLLVEAEAAELGWISADANTLYEAGIKSSFSATGAKSVDKYLATAKVKLSSDKATALKQIVTQRFLAGFLTDGVEAWSDWRRYNIPILPIEENQTAHQITVYPYRMQYGDNDIQYDKDAAEEAISKYFGGNDTRWQRLWWDTADNK